MADDDLSRLRIDKPGIAARPRRGRRPAWWAAAALAAAGVTALLVFTGRLGGGPVVEVAAVSRLWPSQSLSLLNASGHVVAQRKAAVASKLTGRLVELRVEEGDAVKEGEVVARLESADAEAARDQAAANLAVARARLEEALAERTDATLQHERIRRLLGTGAVSRSQYDASEARYRRGRALVSSMEAAVTSAEAALRSADVGLEYTLIRAPFDAVVLTKDADVGDIVTPLGAAADAKAAVVNIADLDSLQVEVDVSETNLHQVQVGQPCEIQLDALPGRWFPGQVGAIIPTADRTKASVKVKVAFSEKVPGVLPEMSAKVAFLSRPSRPEEREPCTAVPAAALASRDGAEVVFLVAGGRAEARAVRPGIRFGEWVEVAGGVQPGDRVVVRPPESLRGGARVRTEGE